VAIAAQWQTVATVTTTAGTVFTTASSGYHRDLVVSNSGASTIFVGLGASNVATSVASFQIPTGGEVVLTQCQIPAGVPLTACTGAGSSIISVGYGTVVSVV